MNHTVPPELHPNVMIRSILSLIRSKNEPMAARVTTVILFPILPAAYVGWWIAYLISK